MPIPAANIYEYMARMYIYVRFWNKSANSNFLHFGQNLTVLCTTSFYMVKSSLSTVTFSPYGKAHIYMYIWTCWRCQLKYFCSFLFYVPFLDCPLYQLCSNLLICQRLNALRVNIFTFTGWSQQSFKVLNGKSWKASLR